MTAGDHVSRGYELKRAGKLAEAVVEYDKAVELGGRTTGPFMARGELHFEMKKYQLAIEDYTRAIKLDRSLADAYAQRAVCYAEIGEDPKSDADAVLARKLADEAQERKEQGRAGRMGKELGVLGRLFRANPGADPNRLAGMAGRQAAGEHESRGCLGVLLLALLLFR